MSATPNADTAGAPKGHPRGLYVLFFTEMWERFSYYGMRALLVLYLLNYLQFQPEDSSAVYKWYTSLVYLTPLLGGFLADRFMGPRMAIITGAVLMAIGHFLMAFEPLPFFYTALAFLIAGNGFFKPNISTMVGKMYKQGDARRDGAFTIFYMGINIGAFLAPLVCGWLRQNMGPVPGMGFHYGFAAAGVGMVFGLLIFLSGQKHVLRAVAEAGNLGDVTPRKHVDRASPSAPAEEPDEKVPGTTGVGAAIAKGFPYLLFVLAVVVPARFLYLAFTGQAEWTNVIMPVAFGAIGAWMGFTLLTVKGAARDKSTVIFVLFTFSVLFWMAYEQAGNALNVWAEYNTRKGVLGLEISAEYFQAAPAIFIVIFAPLFAMTWTALARRGREVPSAAKMLLAIVFIAASDVVMVAAATSEDATVTRVPLAGVPQEIKLEELNAGRFSYDPSTQELSVRGVLAPFAVINALKPTVDPAYLQQVEALELASESASPEHPVTVPFEDLPPGYIFPLTDAQGPSAVRWDADKRTVTLVAGLSPVAKSRLVGAGAQPEWRQAITSLAEKSQAARVSGLWLLLSYLLAVFGELCISPVGLSMVTKLAPVRFASLFMGVFMLSNAVAQYVGGSLGEMWGRIVPTSYFAIFVYTSAVGAVVLLFLQRPLRRLMHDVK
jgi:POT family proton-dependent oligopeptide transporter